ncbi:hypothetical protein Tco_0383109 [Tanacetum coccineum]
MGRDTVQLETAVSTITQEYLLEFTSGYGILEDLHPELPDRGDRIVDFPKERSACRRESLSYPVAWRTSAPKDSMPLEGTYSVEDVAILNARRTPIQKQPETLLCLVGLSRRYFWEIMLDGFVQILLTALNPALIKTGTRPVLLMRCHCYRSSASRQIDMEEPAATSEFFGAPSTIERSPLEFSNKNPSEQINEGDGAEDQGSETMAFVVPPVGPLLTTGAAPTIVEEEEAAADAPLVSKRRRKRANEESNVNAPRKTLTGTMNPDPISFAKPSFVLEQDIAQSSKGATVSGGPKPDPTSPTIVMSLGGIYQPEWGVTNGCRLDTPSSCQELVDHLAPPGYGDGISVCSYSFFSFRLLRKSVAQVARRDQRIQAMEGEKKNLDTLLEAEADMRKAAEAKNAELVMEMEKPSRSFMKTFANVVSPDHKSFCGGLKYGGGAGEAAKVRLGLWSKVIKVLCLGSDGKFIGPMQLIKGRTHGCAYGVLIFGKRYWGRRSPMDLIVCHTHGVGSAHHARSDGVPVSVPTAVPVLRAPWESCFVCPTSKVHIRIRMQDLWPLGLQPTYTTRAARWLANLPRPVGHPSHVAMHASMHSRLLPLLPLLAQACDSGHAATVAAAR